MREPGHNGRYRGGRAEESGAVDNGSHPATLKVGNCADSFRFDFVPMILGSPSLFLVVNLNEPFR